MSGRHLHAVVNGPTVKSIDRSALRDTIMEAFGIDLEDTTAIVIAPAGTVTIHTRDLDRHRIKIKDSK